MNRRGFLDLTCKLATGLPFVTLAAALARSEVYSLPVEYRGKAFLIATGTFGIPNTWILGSGWGIGP